MDERVSEQMNKRTWLLKDGAAHRQQEFSDIIRGAHWLLGSVTIP
jgi:hypothetical protein